MSAVQLWLAKRLLVGGQAVAKSLSAPPPGLLAGRVFSCHMALLLSLLSQRCKSRKACEAMPFSTLPVSTAVSVDIAKSLSCWGTSSG